MISAGRFCLSSSVSFLHGVGLPYSDCTLHENSKADRTPRECSFLIQRFGPALKFRALVLCMINDVQPFCEISICKA